MTNEVKRSRGRPKVDSKPVTVRLLREDLNALDAWIAERGYLPSRPEAIRQLMREGLLQKDISSRR